MTELVTITDGKVNVSVSSIAEAKLAIKQLKLKKKEYNLLKKEIVQKQKSIRTM